jgi:hypothetical protein
MNGHFFDYFIRQGVSRLEVVQSWWIGGLWEFTPINECVGTIQVAAWPCCQLVPVPQV